MRARLALLVGCAVGSPACLFPPLHVTGRDAGPLPADVADASQCPAAATADLCAAVPTLPACPTIDGVAECGALEVPAAWQQWFSDVAGTPAPQVPARTSVAWTPCGLYVFVAVDRPTRFPAPTTDNLWCGDGVEIYVDSDGVFRADGQYDDPGTSQFVVAAPADALMVARRGTIFRPTQRVRPWQADGFAAFPRAGGYDVEAVIRAADLDLPTWSRSAGDYLGLSIALNVGQPASDAGPCANLLGQFRLHQSDPPGDYCGPACTVRAFCRPRIGP